MAFLYKRSRSPYWWIKWRDERGEIQRESLGLRIGIGSETKRAREIRAQRTLEEAKAAATVSRRGDTQDMIVWVSGVVSRSLLELAADTDQVSRVLARHFCLLRRPTDQACRTGAP
jgi:hypothetical protein